MEKKRTIFDYLGQVLMIFGITILILNVFCVVFGENAKEISTMFAMGSDGISVSTSFQFLLVSIIVVVLRFLFFTDSIIKNMSLPVRTGSMYVAIISVILVMNWVFGWFPADMWQAWLGFVLSFIVCSVVSTITVLVKDKLENEKMQDALKKYKQEK
ncbi:MAG: hypothetical protein IJO85_09545 [Lachnospiraceae bacterium]|nr:hypothetical protein [Lachnospiraceae bacterium]